MGTTAEKLTYLNDTKSLLKTAINYTGANITNDTFRSYPKKLKYAYIDIINNGTDTLYSNMPKVSGTGSNLSLTPTYEAPMELEYKGQTSQASQPTPSSPIPIENVTGRQVINSTGKNLFDENYENISSTLIYKPFYVGNGTFTLSTTAPLNTSNNANLFFLSGNVSTGASTSSNGVYINNSRQVQSVNGYVTIAYRNLQSVNPTDYNTQLEKSSSATTYEAYKNNSYEVNLGKNLLNIPDGTYSHNGVSAVVSNGEITLNGTASGTSFIGINVDLSLNSGNYVLSTNNSETKSDTGTYIRFDSDANSICTFTTQNNSKTITLSSNTTYSQLVIRTTSGISFTDFVIKPQLEKGSSSSSYSPYFTPIELNKIGDYQDRIYKDNGKWYLEKNIGKVVLDGSEAWSYDSNSLFFVSSNAISNYSRSNNIPYCDYYKGVSNVNTGGNINNNEIAFNNNVSNDRLYVKNTNITSATDFKTWLSNNNTTIYYVLNTPTTTEITNTELLEDLETIKKSQEGTTNISVDGSLPFVLNASALMSE